MASATWSSGGCSRFGGEKQQEGEEDGGARGGKKRRRLGFLEEPPPGFIGGESRGRRWPVALTREARPYGGRRQRQEGWVEVEMVRLGGSFGWAKKKISWDGFSLLSSIFFSKNKKITNFGGREEKFCHHKIVNKQPEHRKRGKKKTCFGLFKVFLPFAYSPFSKENRRE